MASPAFEQLDAQMRGLEVFHQTRIAYDTRVIIRLDGRCFSKLTEKHFEKPFCPTLHRAMIGTAQHVMEELGAIYTYTESDEISLLLPSNWNMFSREHEKLVSVSAALAAGFFSSRTTMAVSFDSRVIIPNSVDEITNYFRWRMMDANRCCLNTYVYWTLRQAGKSVGEATRACTGADFKEKIALLANHGIAYNTLPLWQRRGTGLYWLEYDKEGYDPIKQESVTARRRKIHVDEELPGTIDYMSNIAALIAVFD